MRLGAEKGLEAISHARVRLAELFVGPLGDLRADLGEGEWPPDLVGECIAILVAAGLVRMHAGSDRMATALQAAADVMLGQAEAAGEAIAMRRLRRKR